MKRLPLARQQGPAAMVLQAFIHPANTVPGPLLSALPVYLMDSPQQPSKAITMYSRFIHEETAPQRGYKTCPRLPSTRIQSSLNHYIFPV